MSKRKYLRPIILTVLAFLILIFLLIPALTNCFLVTSNPFNIEIANADWMNFWAFNWNSFIFLVGTALSISISIMIYNDKKRDIRNQENAELLHKLNSIFKESINMNVDNLKQEFASLKTKRVINEILEDMNSYLLKYELKELLIEILSYLKEFESEYLEMFNTFKNLKKKYMYYIDYQRIFSGKFTESLYVTEEIKYTELKHKKNKFDILNIDSYIEKFKDDYIYTVSCIPALVERIRKSFNSYIKTRKMLTDELSKLKKNV